jgi:hypothetical protein
VSEPDIETAIVDPEAPPAAGAGGFPLRGALVGVLLGWALRRGGAALLREARARAGADGRLTLAEASALLREHLVRLATGQLRSRLSIARQLAVWIAGLAVLGPAAWLALRT